MNNTFKMTATLNKSGRFYQHFGIRPVLVSLYGDKVEDIRELTMKISEDQTIPKGVIKEPDYWGWYDNDKKLFSIMIYAQRFLLEMCFPYGLKAEEDAEKGKAYRLEIVNVEPYIETNGK